jgi:hypothetical protein
VRSGLVLIDEEYSSYLRDILQLVLKDDVALQQKIRIYAVRSASVNAVALANGTILINLGLIAQLENEAQLAFVIAHEAAHVEKEHSLDLYMKNVKISRGESKQEVFAKTDMDIKQFRRHLHSRENENEADNIGFKRFAKTGYRLSNVNKVFDVLKYAHLPFDEVKFEKEFLQPNGVVIPENYLQTDLPPIKGQDENDDDTDKTHPNLAKRRDNINSLISGSGKNEKEGNDYLLSQAKFERLQKIARFELPMLTLHQHAFALTIYNTFLLSKIEKESLYLEKVRLKALYGCAKHRTDEEGNLIAEARDAEKVHVSEGESNQVAHLLHDIIKDKELCLLALLYAWDLHKKYPQDKEVEKMYRDLAWLLPKYFEDVASLRRLAATSPKDEPKDKEEKQDSTQTGKKTKLEKIKSKGIGADKKDKEKKADIDFQEAVSLLLKDNEFTQMYEDFSERSKKKGEVEEAMKKEMEKERKRRYKKGASLGLDKIVVVTPHYLIVNPLSEKQPINLVESENGAKDICDNINKFSKDMQLETVLLAKNEFKANDTDKFNDMVLLNDWFREQNDAGKMSIWGYKQNEIEAIAEKYGTNNFLWMGIIASESTSETIMMAVLFNVKTGQNEIVKNIFMRKKGSDWLINMHLYDVLNQIKAKSKSKKK